MTDTFFNYNNMNLIILPGNYFSTHELKSRLHYMEIPFDENKKNKKQYYENLYNEALKLNDNKRMIINLLISDTNNQIKQQPIQRQFEQNQQKGNNFPEKFPKFSETNNFPFNNNFNNETNQKPFNNPNYNNIIFPNNQTMNNNNNFQNQNQNNIMNIQKNITNTPYNVDNRFNVGMAGNNFNEVNKPNYNINQNSNFTSVNRNIANNDKNNNYNMNNNQFPNNSNYSNNQNQNKNFEFNTPNQNINKNFPQSNNNFNVNEINKSNQNYNYKSNNYPQNNVSNNVIKTPNQNQNLSFQNSNDVNEEPNVHRTNLNNPNNNFQKSNNPKQVNYPSFQNESNNTPFSNFPNPKRTNNNLHNFNNNMNENNPLKNIHNDFPVHNTRVSLVTNQNNYDDNNYDEESNFFNKERIDVIYSLLAGLFAVGILGVSLYFISRYTSSNLNVMGEGVNFLSNPKQFFALLFSNLTSLFKKLFTDYKYYIIPLYLFIFVFIYLQYQKKRKNIVNDIFNDLKNSLIEKYNDNNENGIRGIPESEIISTYSLKYNITQEEFNTYYLPALKRMRRKTPNIKQYEGINNGHKQIFWYWTD